jgi:hypothetical protein
MMVALHGFGRKRWHGKLTFFRQQLEAGGVLAWELGAAQ